MLFDKKLYAGNSAALRTIGGQFSDVLNQRNQVGNAALHQMMVNAGARPDQLYQEWDQQTIRQFRLDEGDNILNRLMPLSRPVPIGRLVLGSTRSSDVGVFQQSLTGEHGSVFENVDCDTDKAIIPVSSNGFKRNWRENQQLSLESFDDASVQQAESVRTHRQGVISSFMDGHKDKDGNLISVDGVSWAGVRSDSRVDQVDLGAGGLNVDFTSAALTGENFVAGFIQLAQRRYITNKIMAPATYFVSNEIYWNMARDYSDNKGDNTILQRCMTIPGVGEIVPSSVLSGNQVLSLVLSTQYIQPLTGMAVSTVAIPRLKYNDPFAFEVVSAIGWQVKTDFETQNSAAQYASS